MCQKAVETSLSRPSRSQRRGSYRCRMKVPMRSFRCFFIISVTRDALELLIRVVGQEPSTESHVTSPTESPGLSVLTKLIFFGVIVGIVLGLLKTRKPAAEKSLA